MRRRYHPAVAAALGLSLAAAAPARAGDDASTEGLVWAGAGMAVPTYFLGVALHEGSHALAAKAFGAEVLELALWPSIRHGRFYFGYTRWRGDLTDCEKVWALLAPKVTNGLLFGAYTALLLSDTLPEHDYGRLAITVLATGQWVDFTRSLFSFSIGDDIVRVHAFYGRTTEGQRLPYRLLYAGLSAAGGYVLYRGWRDVFDDDYSPAVMVPVVWTF